MSDIKYEIEMLNIGDADAFIINYMRDKENYLIIIDAGNTKRHGEIVLQRLSTFYPGRNVDLAINTHLDQDHIKGFETIVDGLANQGLTINEFWIHDRWSLFDEKNLNETFKSKNEKLFESIRQSKNLIKKLDSLGISHKSPFPGQVNFHGLFDILGPSESYYKTLVPEFRGFGESVLNEVLKGTKPDKSAENNSSIIMLFKPIAGKNYLFTGDAGPYAFERITWPKKVYWLQVPHHGSMHNFDNVLLTLNPEIAYISAINDEKHPHADVVKKLEEKKCKVYCSSDGSKLHYRGTDGRKDKGYKTATIFSK